MGDDLSCGKKIKEIRVDTDSPYCFHASEYPRQMHVTIAKNEQQQGRIKPKAACVEPNQKSNSMPGLNVEQYHALLDHLAGEGSPSEHEPKPEANMAGNFNRSNDWVIDSGCTEHITHQAEWLEGKMVSTDESPVMIPNGESIPVVGKGSCRLPNGTTIKGVLHVPKFKCNLLSVSRLTRDHQCSVTFFPDFLFYAGLAFERIDWSG